MYGKKLRTQKMHKIDAAGGFPRPLAVLAAVDVRPIEPRTLVLQRKSFEMKAVPLEVPVRDPESLSFDRMCVMNVRPGIEEAWPLLSQLNDLDHAGEMRLRFLFPAKGLNDWRIARVKTQNPDIDVYRWNLFFDHISEMLTELFADMGDSVSADLVADIDDVGNDEFPDRR